LVVGVEMTIKDILKKHCHIVKIDGIETIGPNVAHTAILKIIEDMVPEKHLYANGAEALGWNECRQTFLDRLEQLKAEVKS